MTKAMTTRLTMRKLRRNAERAVTDTAFLFAAGHASLEEMLDAVMDYEDLLNLDPPPPRSQSQSRPPRSPRPRSQPPPPLDT